MTTPEGTTRLSGRVLIVAGSDSGGGAGIQADIKAVTALGGYAMTAITALTAQDTRGVHGIFPVDLAFIGQQMEVVLDDLGADCIKTGMLHSAAVVDLVVETLAREAPGVPLVADTVMVAKGGAALLQPEAVEAVRTTLVPAAAVITPNLPEAAALLDRPVETEAQMEKAAVDLLALGPRAVLLKGGHLAGDRLVDLLATEQGEMHRFEGPRLDTPNTHGTGCTLASALACGLAQGLSLTDATARARDYVRIAIETAPGFGSGHGPLNHAHTVRPFGLPSA